MLIYIYILTTYKANKNQVKAVHLKIWKRAKKMSTVAIRVMGLARKRRFRRGYSRLLLPGINTSIILAITKKM